MSTYMAKANEIEKKWYIIDAAGKPLGRVAATAATILRGKHRPQYTPGVDCGEFVIIINAKDAVLTGNKLMQKKWYRHTGYICCGNASAQHSGKKGYEKAQNLQRCRSQTRSSDTRCLGTSVRKGTN